PRAPWKRREHGSRRKPKAGFHRLPHSLGNLAKGTRFPLSHRAGFGFCFIQKKSKGQNQNPQSGGLRGRLALFHKADRSLINKTGQLDLLTTITYDRSLTYFKNWSECRKAVTGGVERLLMTFS